MDNVKNGYSHSGHKTLYLAVFQKEIDEINWGFACCYKFKKAKNKSSISFAWEWSNMSVVTWVMRL